jgi:putative transcriptional regulator
MSVPQAVREAVARQIAGDIVLSSNPGASLRKWREIFDVTQAEMARRLNISQSVISDYEACRRRPGVGFVRRFIESLISLDECRGGPIVRRLTSHVSGSEAIIDIKEFQSPVKAERISEAVEGIALCCREMLDRDIYGYTILDSIRAIQTLSGVDFYQILGTTTERALVFTNVSTGRSPMVAVRVQTLKPRMVVLHGLRDVDKLAIQLAELERIPLVKSMKPSVESIVAALNSLYAESKSRKAYV